MRKQRIPPVDDLQILETIISAKQGSRKDRLRSIKEIVNNAYSDFVANGSYLGSMVPIALEEIEKNDMEHCYSSTTTGLSDLKTAIKMNHQSLDRELCPYCGVREPSEFDHYLPKSKFQEFSIFSKNLIWVCHRCNHQKREHYVNSDRYLNCYFDAIPTEQFLFCTIGVPIEEHGISFYFKRPVSLTLIQFNDIVSHAKKLKLIETYKNMASQKLPIWLKKWRLLSDSYDKAGLRNHLLLDIDADLNVETEKYGKNHYKCVLKLGIKACLNEIVEEIYT